MSPPSDLKATEVRLTPRLCRAARALVGWRQEDLCSSSGVARSTLEAFEAKEGRARLSTMNNRALVGAFEHAGLQFIPENGGGYGVRLREPERDG